MDATLTIRIDADLRQAIEAEARRTNRSKGHVARQALAAYVGKKQGSALDALERYAGILDGPPDLSTNRARLAGLGRRTPAR